MLERTLYRLQMAEPLTIRGFSSSIGSARNRSGNAASAYGIASDFKIFHDDETRRAGRNQTCAVALPDGDLPRTGPRGRPRDNEARRVDLGAETGFGNREKLARRSKRRLIRLGALAPISFLLAGFVPAHADCLDDAATYWKVPTALARAIAMQESGMRPSVVSTNRDGSRDFGLMQINSSWLPRLARYGIHQQDLLNACTNAYVGNWILAQNIERLGLTWDAVGAYNATSPDKRDRYARNVYRQLMAVQAGTTPSLDH